MDGSDAYHRSLSSDAYALHGFDKCLTDYLQDDAIFSCYILWPSELTLTFSKICIILHSTHN